MLFKRRAKILGTIGPASESVEVIKKLIMAGMNGARINMSHGTHEEHKKHIHNIRKASKETGREVAIVLDLQGPKIRVDQLDAPLNLNNGEKWVIAPKKILEKIKVKNGIPSVYEDLVNDVEVGERILFNDGLIHSKVVSKIKDYLEIEIMAGGELTSKKGINLPDSAVTAPSFTEKDEKDLLFGLEHGIDYIALSYARSKEDVKKVKDFLAKKEANVGVMTKIENPPSIKNLDGILDLTDMIIVARGDMGAELGNHLVPKVQKDIIKKCNERGIPVATATQMLESMIHNPTPTRAEANDVANAIWDGSDIVMLSGETAAGKFPVESVAMMNKIVEEAEKTPKERPFLRNMDLSETADAIMVASSMIAEKVNAKRVMVITESGNAALHISRFRPLNRVLAVTHTVEVVRQMSLYWGVSPFLLKTFDEKNTELEYEVIELVKKECDLEDGDRLVIARGEGKLFPKGMSNSIRVVTYNK